MIQQMQQVLDTPTLINKPFFSVIIPAYNCKETLLYLLQSLVDQQLSKEELQVIISDDCSTISYDYIINSFKEQLNVRKVLSPYNGGVGNNRQNGVKYAHGEYITFIDQDDLFIKGALLKVKEVLLNNPGIDYLITGLEYRSPENNTVLMRYIPTKLDRETGYLHGKFFHLENFWKKYSLHFPKDLRSHEDIALTFQLMAIQEKYKKELNAFKTDLITYIWYKQPDSQTNKLHYYQKEEQPRQFYDIWFDDYVNATLNTLLQFYEEHQYEGQDKLRAFTACCKCLYLIYQRSERNLYQNPKVIKKNYDYLQTIIDKMLKYFDIILFDIDKWLSNNPQIVKDITSYATSTAGYYRTRFSFSKWLNLVYDKQIVSQMEKQQKERKIDTLRPYYSIVVPCYNSKNVLRPLLESIVQQHMLKNEIEVILADDCSTESYQDLVDEYKYKLNIKQTKTAYNCCPGNTRQAGVDVATGEWLIFSDHDDAFFPDVLPKVRQEIEKSHCDTAVFTKFVKTNKDRTAYKQMPSAGWTHGKIFNKDNFWDKYHFHYIKDLTSHEDISISSQINCVFSREKETMKVLYLDIITYQWVEREESESNRVYHDEFGVERPFLDIFYIDYLSSTAGVYYSKYKEGLISKQFAEEQIKQVLLYAYFYAEGNYFMTGSYLKKNYQEVTKYINILKDEFGLTVEDIFNYYKDGNPEVYKEIFQTGLIATGIVIYNYTLKDWLYKMANGDY